MRILVVDDDKDGLYLTGAMVKQCGHVPVTASDSAQALALIADMDIRVVISDWEMPGLTGIDLVRALRADRQRPYVYFIVLTGKRIGSINYMEAMDAGADDYMEKPAHKDLLKVRLRVAERILKLDTQMKDLSRLVPVCASCRRVRRDDQAYESIEAYISKNSEFKFSHGICPDCMKKLYPQVKGQ